MGYRSARLSRERQNTAVYRYKETIAMPRNRLYESGILSGIPKRIPQASNRCVEAILEVNEGIGTPESRPEFLSTDNLAAMLHQFKQNVVRLLLDFNLDALSAELASSGVQFKDPEPIYGRGLGRCWHSPRLN
jgi:hypothetical protein